MSSFDGNRQHLRRRISVEVRVVQDLDRSLGELVFESVDLSEGGAFLQSDLLLDLGDEIEVTIPLPSRDKPLVARARVAWVTRDDRLKGGAGMGVQFVAMALEDHNALSEFLRGH